MAEFEEHSSQFFYHWMGAMASSQDTEPMDVQNEVSLLVLVLVLICVVC